MNYWALPAYLSDRFLIDVGLRLKNESGHEVKELEIALPCGTDGNALEDITSLLKTPATAALVFGGKVTIAGDSIAYDGHPPVQLNPVALPECKRLADWCSKSFSLWRLNLSTTLTPGSECYVRVRFRVDSIGRTWTWKRSIFSRNGARVDLRVSDTREAYAVKGREALVPRMCSLARLYAFVMVPGWLEPALVSPEPHYVRLMETHAWSSYLRRGAGVGGRQLLIYQWRAEDVNESASFQGFMELRRAVPLLHSWNYVRSAVTLLIIAATFALFLEGEPLHFVVTSTASYADWALKAIIGVGVVTLASAVPVVRDWIGKVRRGGRRVEDWLLARYRNVG